MLIKFTETIWLNVKPWEVKRIDVDTVAFENLTERAAYYVRVTLEDRSEEYSDYFKTYDEAATCAEKLAEALTEELARA